MEDILQALKSRFKSPVLGNFILSWLIVNWQIPYLTIFVDELNIRNKNKLFAVNAIIKGYGDAANCYLIYIPLVMTLLIVIGLPWLQTQVDKIAIHFEYIIAKYKESKSIKYQSLDSSYKSLNAEFQKLEENTRNELFEKFKNPNLNLAEVFIGKWTIEIFNNNSHQSYFNCTFISDKFVCDSGEVLRLYLSEFSYINQQFKATCNVTFASDLSNSIGYNLFIKSRSVINFIGLNGVNSSIKLTWEKAIV
jgi:hypothetical protein